MFTQFNPEARQVISGAEEEAGLLRSDYVGSEHILLGLLRESDSGAARALERLGVSLDAVRHQVQEFVARNVVAQSATAPFTPNARKLMDLSLREARGLGHSYVGAEHLLLAAVGVGRGIAAQILLKQGVDLGRVRQTVVEILTESQAACDAVPESPTPLLDIDWLIPLGYPPEIPLVGGVRQEERLRRHFEEGTWLRCDGPDPVPFHGNAGIAWAGKDTIRGEDIAALLCTGTAMPGRQRTISVAGARIVGDIDLSGLRDMSANLRLARCRIDGSLILTDAYTQFVMLTECTVVEVQASRSQLASFTLTRCRTGMVGLSGAEVAKDLSLGGSTITDLAASDLRVGTLLSCRAVADDRGVFHPFRARSIWLLNAQIAGNAYFDGAVVSKPSAVAIDCTQMSVGGSVFMCAADDNALTVQGTVMLTAATIGKQLNLRGVRLSAGQEGVAFSAAGLTVHGGVEADQRAGQPEGARFSSDGHVSLYGCRLTGSLKMTGARIGGVLNLNDAIVGIDVSLDAATDESGACAAFQADRVSVGRAVIGGSLSLCGATLTGSLEAFRVELKGDLNATAWTDLSGGSVAMRAVSIQLTSADIGGDVVLDGAQLTNVDGVALHLVSAKIGGSLYGRGAIGSGRFECQGSVTLTHAVIVGDVELNRCSIVSESAYAIMADYLAVAGHVTLGAAVIDGGSRCSMPGSAPCSSSTGPQSAEQKGRHCSPPTRTSDRICARGPP